MSWQARRAFPQRWLSQAGCTSRLPENQRASPRQQGRGSSKQTSDRNLACSRHARISSDGVPSCTPREEGWRTIMGVNANGTNEGSGSAHLPRGLSEPIPTLGNEGLWEPSVLSGLLTRPLTQPDSSDQRVRHPGHQPFGNGPVRRDELNMLWRSLERIGKRLRGPRSSRSPQHGAPSESDLEELTAWLLTPSNKLGRLAAAELRKFMKEEIKRSPSGAYGPQGSKQKECRVQQMAKLLATHFVGILFSPRPPSVVRGWLSHELRALVTAAIALRDGALPRVADLFTQWAPQSTWTRGSDQRRGAPLPCREQTHALAQRRDSLKSSSYAWPTAKSDTNAPLHSRG